MWIDIASIIFICVTVNHLGLISAVEQTVRHRLPVLNCPKCLTFWSVFVYGMSGDGTVATNPSLLLRLLAISFLCAYIALWLELCEGFIDTIYLWLYEKIFATNPATNDTPAADTDNGDTPGTVS